MERMTAKEVAELLRLSETKVRDLAKRSRNPLPCRDYGGSIRFLRSEVLEWDKQQTNAV